MRQKRVLYALLFAVHPVLWLYASNSTEVRLSNVISPLLLSVGLGTVLLMVFRLVLRDSIRAALLTSLVLLAFFTFGHAVGGWQSADLPGDARLVVGLVWAMVVLVLSIALAKTRRDLTRFSNTVGLMALFLVATTFVQLGVRWYRFQGERSSVRQLESTAPKTLAPRRPTAMPDIYYIILDGYARNDAMREIYGFDNSPFLDHLRARGFQVSEDSRANYCKTLHAFASTLNMQYLHELVNVPPTSADSDPLIRLVLSNRTVHLLHESGYSIVAFASGYDLAEFSRIDHYLDRTSSWSEFTNLVLGTTPVPWMLGKKHDLHTQHRQRLEYILDKLPHVREGTRPRFVFAHLLAPHPPFVFDRDGRAVAIDRPFGLYDGSDYYKYGGTKDEYVSGYAEQARWVTEQLQKALDALLERYGEEPPIIIVHSDHGPGSGLDWKSLPDTDLNERFGIFMATYLPGHPTVDLGHQFSPVNVFRMIFDVYFGTNMGPLEHRSYYTLQSLPFRYFDVTDPDRPTVLE